MSNETKTTEAKKIEKTEAAEVPVTEQVMAAPPSTVYETVLASMTPGKLAALGVKLISVNNSELFWVTSVGQLYAFDAHQKAMNAEFNWLMSKPE